MYPYRVTFQLVDSEKTRKTVILKTLCNVPIRSGGLKVNGSQRRVKADKTFFLELDN